MWIFPRISISFTSISSTPNRYTSEITWKNFFSKLLLCISVLPNSKKIKQNLRNQKKTRRKKCNKLLTANNSSKKTQHEKTKKYFRIVREIIVANPFRSSNSFIFSKYQFSTNKKIRNREFHIKIISFVSFSGNLCSGRMIFALFEWDHILIATDFAVIAEVHWLLGGKMVKFSWNIF